MSAHTFSVYPTMFELFCHELSLLCQQSLVEATEATRSSLIGPFCLHICWEAVDVHMLLLHVIHKVSVVVDNFASCNLEALASTLHHGL